MKRIFFSAIYTSPPNSMGGNTKIALELINHLNTKYKFTVLTTEPETFTKNIKNPSKIEIVPIKFPFKRFALTTHFQEIQYISRFYEKYFLKNPLTKNDYFFAPSDFAPDVLPIYKLKEKYNFIWIPTLFLFIPSPIENLLRGYKFPFVKYILYYFYQRFLFSKMLEKGDLFVITNDYDKKMFPKKLQKKIVALYGGVNIDQLYTAKKSQNKKYKKEYDAVFCSRLHPQKGISQLLDIWKMVVEKKPDTKLAIMGNGEKPFEEFLHRKAKRLGLNKNITWMGFVDGVKKYEVYQKSKLLVHGTIYDNNGMVAAEALCSGLPVVMYNLPALKKLYTVGCYKVKAGDKKAYAAMVLTLLREKVVIKQLEKEKIIQEWQWETKAKLFDEFIKQKALQRRGK